MDYASTSADERLAELNAALTVVGRLPRLLHGALFVFCVLVSLPAMHMHEPISWLLFASGVPLVMFILSLRIKAYATREALVVRSYLRTYVARYEDVLGFVEVGYAGIWTNFNGTDSWRNMGLRVINVYILRGRDIELSATMMRRRSSERIVELLNSWVPDEMPPESLP